MLTKSPLIVRDMDLLTELESVEVGLTVTSVDDRLSQIFERRAPSQTARLRALKRAVLAGITTYAFVGPLLPHLRLHPQSIETLIAGLAGIGVTSVYVEHLNLSPPVSGRIARELSDWPLAVRECCDRNEALSGRAELDTVVCDAVRRHGVTLRTGQVLTHNRPQFNSASVPQPGLDNTEIDCYRQ